MQEPTFLIWLVKSLTTIKNKLNLRIRSTWRDYSLEMVVQIPLNAPSKQNDSHSTNSIIMQHIISSVQHSNNNCQTIYSNVTILMINSARISMVKSIRKCLETRNSISIPIISMEHATHYQSLHIMEQLSQDPKYNSIQWKTECQELSQVALKHKDYSIYSLIQNSWR